MNRLVIGIDSSTTACKAIAWDRFGHAVAEGCAAYALLQPKPGWHEQDAQAWWSGACQALRACMAQVDARQVVAIGITHQRESFVLVDADGRPLRNAILWDVAVIGQPLLPRCAIRLGGYGGGAG